jgi:hypothetical protein
VIAPISVCHLSEGFFRSHATNFESIDPTLSKLKR